MSGSGIKVQVADEVVISSCLVMDVWTLGDLGTPDWRRTLLSGGLGSLCVLRTGRGFGGAVSGSSGWLCDVFRVVCAARVLSVPVGVFVKGLRRFDRALVEYSFEVSRTLGEMEA